MKPPHRIDTNNGNNQGFRIGFRGIAFFAILLAIYINRGAPEPSDRLQEWKKKGKLQSLKDRNIFYIEEKGHGSSGTVICLHGFPTSSYDWIKILPDLKKQFSQVIMLDFVGFGFSEKPTDITYTIAEQADIVELLAVKLDVKRAHILSHDYGDTVALELVARFNQKQSKFDLQSLILLNGGIFPDTHYPRLAQKVLLMPVIGYATSHLFNYPLFCRGLAAVFGVKPTTEDYNDFWALLRYNDGDRASYKVINFLRERQEFKDRWVGALKTTSLKVLMIYGPADPVNPPAFASHFKVTVPHQTIVTLEPDIGHYPQWEDPESVSREIIHFIDNLSPSS